MKRYRIVYEVHSDDFQDLLACTDAKPDYNHGEPIGIDAVFPKGTLRSIVEIGPSGEDVARGNRFVGDVEPSEP